MRISDWSSDVCSSDLQAIELRCTLGDADEYALASIGAFYEGKFDRAGPDTLATIQRLTAAGRCISLRRETLMHVIAAYAENPTVHAEVGRASCRVRVGPYVKISVVAGATKKNTEDTKSDHVAR